MVNVKRSRKGYRQAAAVSVGIAFAALTTSGLANAGPDSGSTDSGSTSSATDATPTARNAHRSARQAARQSAAGPTAGSARKASPATASPAAARAPRPALAVTDPAPHVPAALSAVPTAAESPSAVPPAAAFHATAVALKPPSLVGTGAPAQPALAWTMLPFARGEVGRRANGTALSASAASSLSASAASSPSASAASSSTVQPVGQYVSPLGTTQQTAAEADAMRTTRTLPMLAMKAVLNLAWRIIGAQQYSLVGGPDKANLAALDNAVEEWAMGVGFQLMIVNSNEPTIVTQVAPPHQWYGMDVTGSRILYDNPDTIYRFAGVNYASEYVITGRLPEDDPQASFSVLTGTTGTTAAVLNGSQLDLAPDRSFVITVSGAPAAPGQKNHLQTTPDTTLIAIRDTLSDWNTQNPMSLAIQRTAGPPKSLFGQLGGFAIPGIGPLVAQSRFLTALVSLIPPLPAVPPIVRGLYGAILMLRGINQEAVYIKVATTDAVTGQRKGPNVFTDPSSNASFLATQLQSAGYFQLADDQALVLTIRPNNAAYFNVPVTNDWTITDNYWDQQTSLNIAQARSNTDGSYTLVVSPTQPVLAGGTSVWNWVSTGGLNQGTMAIRFQSIDLNNPTTPTVSSQVVSLSNLSSVLPAGTVVVTPIERQAQLTARKQGFDRRFAPYPQS
jgi:hypothetical protein